MAVLAQSPARLSRAYLAGVGLALAAAAAAQAPERWHGPGSPVPPPQATPPQAKSPRSDHVLLGEAISLKFQNPTYAAALATRGKLPPPTYGMAEEGAVRSIRDRLARLRRAPAGMRVETIPRAGAAPTVDGIANPREWGGALRIALQPAERGAWVLLLAHGGALYLAAHAPGDKTADGFDQFRFWYHLELSPFMENERVFVAGKSWLVALRGVRLPRGGAAFSETAAVNTLAQKTDWGIFERLRGASAMAGYRQFEMAVDLAESGLGFGAPFPAFFEIEGDPVYDPAGKFKARFNEGQAGSAVQPIWLQIAR